MAKRIYVVTATKVIENGRVSYTFMFKSNSPFENYVEISGTYGFVELREKGRNEINPFRLVRGEPDAIGPDGKLKWQVFVGTDGEQTFTGHVDESPPDEGGLQQLLESMPDCVLLMERGLFDRFKSACEKADVELKTHHFDGELSTS